MPKRKSKKKRLSGKKSKKAIKSVVGVVKSNKWDLISHFADIKEQIASNRGNQLAMNGTYHTTNLSKFMSFYM